MKRLFIFVLLTILLTACASTGNVNGTGLSLQEAIDQSAEKIAAELPAGSRVAIVAFDSHNDNLSRYIMEELTGALIDSNIEVADRQNLEYVYRELNFNMSGNVSDESAQSIGKFLGAQLVIIGELSDIGSSYRFRTSAIIVEQATRASVSRFNVRNDRAMRDMVTTFANQRNTSNITKYSVSENTMPRTAGAFLDRGILFASRGDYELAIADFTEAVNIDPNLSAAYLLRGRAYYASVSRVINIGENFSQVTVIINKNVSLEMRTIYELAITDFNQAIKLDANNAQTYSERAGAYLQMGDTDRAIADINQAIRLNPNSARFYVNRGVIYAEKGDRNRAIADYNQAIRLDSNNAKAYFNRGIEYLYNTDYDRAIIDFTNAIRLDPNDADAYKNRGAAYVYKGDWNRAITDLTQSLRLYQNDAGTYLIRGITYQYQREYDKAIADLTQAIRLDPDYAAAYQERGNAYNAKGDRQRANADFAMARNLGYTEN